MRYRHFIVGLVLCSLSFAANAEVFRTRLHQLQNPTHSQNDVSAEIEFGRNVAAYVLGRENLISDPDLTRYVTLVGKSLTMHAPRHELEFHFGILNSDTINAYSTPGGYVFITSGALNMVKDESELAAILAHEIAHINARHIVNELNIRGTDADQLNSLTRVISASSDTTRIAANQAIDSAMTLLFNQGFKVKDEIDADQRAMFMLAATGYDPLALARYLTRVDDYLAVNPGHKTPTHPSSQMRYSRMSLLVTEEQLTSNNRLRVNHRFSRYLSKE